MARDLVLAMRYLGFTSFDVLAHDRGARVAHRMDLDTPEAIRSTVLLDILPTDIVWGNMTADIALASWHWPFLASPSVYIEDLVAAAPEALIRACLSPAVTSGAIDTETLRHYEKIAK